MYKWVIGSNEIEAKQNLIQPNTRSNKSTSFAGSYRTEILLPTTTQVTAVVLIESLRENLNSEWTKPATVQALIPFQPLVFLLFIPQRRFGKSTALVLHNRDPFKFTIRIFDVLHSKYKVFYKLGYGTSRDEYVCLKSSMVCDYPSVQRDIKAYEALSKFKQLQKAL